jgi:hypothetical protein
MDEFQQDRFTNINRFTTYPFNYNNFSHYINYRGEDQSNITPAEFSFQAKDLYDIYYKPYVDDLISDENKIYSAKIYLFPQDIERLRWNERILINNTYFRINKITNFNALEPSICDIELVKLTKDYETHPVLYYDLISCSSGPTLHTNSDLMYNLFAYAGNYVQLYDEELNPLGCHGVTVVGKNPNYTYEKFYIASAYTPNLVSVYENCGCTGRTEFEIVQEQPAAPRPFFYSALDCETSATTYTFISTLSQLSGGSVSYKIYNSITTESVCVFDTQPTFIQNTPWTYLSAYTNCEECSFGPPTPSPTTTPTNTPTPSVTPVNYWTLNPCEITEPQYSTTIPPLQASQRYIDPMTLYRWTWNNIAPTTSPLHTVNNSLQRVSGQAECIDVTPTPTSTSGLVTPTPTPTSGQASPTPTGTPTPTPTRTPCSLTIYFNVMASPSPGGWDSSTDACQGNGTPLTVYFSTELTGCPTTFQDVFNDGKVIYTNSSLTTVLAGNNKYYKSVASSNSGIAIQVGNDGLIGSLSSPC